MYLLLLLLLLVDVIVLYCWDKRFILLLLLLLFLLVLFYCVDLFCCNSSKRRVSDVNILYVRYLLYWLDCYFYKLLLLFFTIPLPLYLYTILHNLLISHHYLFLTKIKLSLLKILRLLLMRPILNRVITFLVIKKHTYSSYSYGNSHLFPT